MIGARALSPKEIEVISAELSLRNRCILVLGIRTGFRINELLSLDVRDVVDENGNIRGTVKVHRRHVKGKGEGQAVPLHREAVAELQAYLKAFPGSAGEPLFRSIGTGGKKPGRLEYTVFRKALLKACSRSGIGVEQIGTHSMRKAYAKNMYKALGENVFKLQKALRHKSPSSTIHYVDVDEDEIKDAILGKTRTRISKRGSEDGNF